MAEVLLQTKLYKPPIRPSLVPRPRLKDKLNKGLDHKLTLISAPAGFGKTTLVTTWLSEGERPYVWVSIDEDDNDLVRFFTYAAAAIQQIKGVGSSIDGLLEAPQPVPFKSLVTAFINDCTTAESPFICTLDDYHLIAEPAVNEAVAFLLDNSPPQLHLVITCRADPLLPLSRFRGRGQMTELRTEDLRFTAEEAVVFLQRSMGLQLSIEQISALETRTEGWIAGLQMAGLSIQGLAREDEIAAFVADFTASHRYIFDYLTDEVLAQRPSDTQEFLLKTSILDRLNTSLCEAVTGQKNCGLILETLEKSNIFLFPLDKKREWYRYHHLFADLLRQRLHRRHPELAQILSKRASHWYAERGEIETAFQYALAGGDVDEAARLLDKVALDFIRRSEIRKLHKLIERLPEDALFHYPRLCVARGWVLMFMGEFDLAEICVRQLAGNLKIPAELNDVFPKALIKANIATIRAYGANRQGNLPEAISYSNEALALLETLPEEMSQQLSGAILINLGQTQVATDAVENAEINFQRAIEYSKASKRVFGVMAAYANYMILARRRGHLTAAKSSGMQGLSWLASFRKKEAVRYPAEGEVRRELGIIAYEQNKLSEAKEHLERGIDLYHFASPFEYANCLHYLFLVEMASEEIEKAIEINRQIETGLSELTPTQLRTHTAYKSWRFMMLSRANPEAPKWFEELHYWVSTLDANDPLPINSRLEPEIFIRAKVMAALGQFDQSLSLLKIIADTAQKALRHGDLIQYLVQESLVLDRLSQREKALEHLIRAITLAESTGHLRTFLNEAKELQPLLSRLPTSHLRETLNIHIQQKHEIARQASKKTSVGRTGIIDPLSERELEVLALLISHLSGPEIAERLHISHNTLKTHTKNVYNKLGVNSRNDAVVRAKEYKLL